MNHSRRIRTRQVKDSARLRMDRLLQALWSISRLENVDLKAVADHILATLVRMTGSQYGFYGFINADETVMSIHSWSGAAMSHCSMVEKPQQFPVATCGLWAEAIRRREPLIVNDYAALHSAKKGLPSGHVPLTNLLVVPHFSHGQMIAVAAVANCPGGYQAQDVTQISTFLASIQVLVESKQAEAALHKTVALLNETQQLAHLGGWEWDLSTQAITWSAEAYRIYEMAPEEMEARYSGPQRKSLQCFNPEDRPLLEAVLLECAAQGTPYDLVLPFTTRRGQKKWIRTCGKAEMENGQVVRVLGHIMDITAYKQVEQDLRLFQSIIQHSQEAIAISDARGNLLYVNPAHRQLFGYPPLEAQAQNFLTHYPPESLEVLHQVVLPVLQRGESWQGDLDVLDARGRRFALWLRADALRDAHGHLLNMFAVAHDVSEARMVEETQAFLLQCGLPGTGEDFFEALARYLAESLEMNYICIDWLEPGHLSARTLAVYHQGRFEDNLSYTLRDTPCGAVLDQQICSYPTGVQRLFPHDAALAELQAESYFGTTLLDSRGQPIGLIAVIGRQPVQDTQRVVAILKLVAPRAAAELGRRQAEQALRQSEEKYHTLFDSAGDAILIYRGTQIVAANQTACDFLGYAQETLVNMQAEQIDVRVRSADVAGWIRRLIQQSQLSAETVLQHLDGTLLPVEVNARLIPWEGQTALMGIYRDIRERKRTQAQLTHNLQEKEILLRELYHRTKNNMMVISSMLSLQALYCSNPDFVSILHDLKGKVEAMALVHCKLYQSQDLSYIDLREYISELTSLLFQNYRLSPSEVALRLELESVTVLLDIAVPCGLVLSELMSNACKHAFPDQRPGEIYIGLKRSALQEIELTFADNGVGVPPGFDFAAQPTLGMQTVYAIVEHQLQGTLQFESAAGLTCRMRFNSAQYSPRV